MVLLGKITFSILGLKYFGIFGIFLGISLGHLIFDRSIITKFISNKLSEYDDTLRIMLPYRFYYLYDKLLSPLFGKLWGCIIGFLVYGWVGSIVFAIFGYFAFDFYNEKLEKLKFKINLFFSENIFTFLGASIGVFTTDKPLILAFSLVGYVIDNIRGNNGLVNRLKLSRVTGFWPRINVLTSYLKSKEAKKRAFVYSMAGLSAKIAQANGKISEVEVEKFKEIFNITSDDNEYMNFLSKAIDSGSVKNYSKQLRYLVKEDINAKEDIIENLFDIAVADKEINIEELNIIKEVASIINLPDGNFEVIRKRYEIKHIDFDDTDYYKVFGLTCAASDKELRDVWRKLTANHHPDKIIAEGGTAQDVVDGNKRMAEINDAYQQIMKQRKGNI